MTESTLALLLFLFPLAFSPGPGNLTFAAIGAQAGLRAAIPALGGYHAATWVVTLALGAGLAGIVLAAPAILTAIRWAGAAYVLWLAWGVLRSGLATTADGQTIAGAASGAMLLLLNPKAYVIIALMLGRFLAPDATTNDLIWIATVFTANNLVAFLVWTVLGDRLTAALRSNRAQRALRLVLAALLAGVALWMLIG